ncbi:hypothetical protein DYI37_05370 [Fulvimarina endophytica]|uniref:Cytochrome c oxidase assembly protein CtaG n=1 Tax=Fulvimarina endophytica TaxID=2293836 RepID=A0A371X7S5_9HYPH|nr:cytochrome c oxidase assembly protein [Fulvimarina endophytica]RFC65270.1 hypothetical protein DYI37_05370 [Fulvimarina endophytica]
MRPLASHAPPARIGALPLVLGLFLFGAGVFGSGVHGAKAETRAPEATPPNAEGSDDGSGAANETATSGLVRLRFESRNLDGVEATFAPREPVTRVEPGKVTRIYFFMSNRSNRTVQLRLNYRVEPDADSVFYNQLQGVCTTGQTLGPWETTFVYDSVLIDPAILDDAEPGEEKVLTVHYTLKPAEDFPQLR